VKTKYPRDLAKRLHKTLMKSGDTTRDVPSAANRNRKRLRSRRSRASATPSAVYFCAHHVARAMHERRTTAGKKNTTKRRGTLYVALVIVASQDGDLTVFAATSKGVMVVRPFILPRATA
jgi:hypothetical protein